jgi:cytochrome c1
LTGLGAIAVRSIVAIAIRGASADIEGFITPQSTAGRRPGQAASLLANFDAITKEAIATVFIRGAWDAAIACFIAAEGARGGYSRLAGATDTGFQAVTEQAVITIGFFRAAAAVGRFIAAKGTRGLDSLLAGATMTAFQPVTKQAVIALVIRRAGNAAIGLFIAA